MNFTAATLTVPEGTSILAKSLGFGGFLGPDLAATFSLRRDEEGWHINFLAVHPLHARRGFGDRALQQAELEARRQGASRLLLDTAEVHPWLLAFYRSRGYEEYGTAHWPGKTYRSILFQKALVDA